VLPNMISSQEGTEERLPRAAFLLWRPACSPTGSVGAAGAATGASPGTAADPPGPLAAGGIAAAGEGVTTAVGDTVETGGATGTDA
jgi:hypothetical protein